MLSLKIAVFKRSDQRNGRHLSFQYGRYDKTLISIATNIGRDRSWGFCSCTLFLPEVNIWTNVCYISATLSAPSEH